LTLLTFDRPHCNHVQIFYHYEILPVNSPNLEVTCIGARHFQYEYARTKFEVLRFTPSKDTMKPPNLKNGSRDPRRIRG